MRAHYPGTRRDLNLWTAPAVDGPEDIKAPMMLMLPGTLLACAVEGPRTCVDLHEKLVELMMPCLPNKGCNKFEMHRMQGEPCMF